MKKYLKRQSNAPGNDTIPQSKSDELIKKYNPDLFNKDKWIRFKMTGEGQGVDCGYIDLKPGADGFPFHIDKSLVDKYNINPNISITMVNKSLDDTKIKAKEALKRLEEK